MQVAIKIQTKSIWHSLVVLGCLTLIQQASASTQNRCKSLYRDKSIGIERPLDSRFEREGSIQEMTSESLGISVRYSPTKQTKNIATVHIKEPKSFLNLASQVWYYRMPILNLRLFPVKEHFHNIGLDAIYQNYGDLVNESLVNTVIRVEKQLPQDRQETYVITDKVGLNLFYGGKRLESENVKGFIRVFDGTDYRYQNITRTKSQFALPLERILLMTGKQTRIVQAKRDEGFQVHEIGKYFIRKSLESQGSLDARRGILLWLRSYILSRGQSRPHESYFFVHVASKVHRIAYERNFGLKPVPKEETFGLDKEEDILIIRGDELLHRINKIISSS